MNNENTTQNQPTNADLQNFAKEKFLSFSRNSLFFNSMLTAKIITFVYWVMIISSIAKGIHFMNAGYSGVTFKSFFWGTAFIIGGSIASRVMCELCIVLFKIHDNLQKIADNK